MSWYTVVLLVALAALGAGDVGAVARSDRDLSRILRPAFGVLLLALAWLGRAESFAAGRAVLLAVAACTAADVPRVCPTGTPVEWVYIGLLI